MNLEPNSCFEPDQLVNQLSILRIDEDLLSGDSSRKAIFVDTENNITFRQYESENDLQSIIPLISKDLSEPYSLYTYRYFIYNWPKLCLLAVNESGTCVGAIVCKLDYHEQVKRGYIAMLAVEKEYRKKGIGSTLVQLAINLMIEEGGQEVCHLHDFLTAVFNFSRTGLTLDLSCVLVSETHACEWRVCNLDGLHFLFHASF
uniref:N-alpha-acetyltransferase 30 n=1 Tax=Schistocephalus solidus TaxID=70667 RepID=A0A0X3PEX6_SCHSO